MRSFAIVLVSLVCVAAFPHGAEADPEEDEGVWGLLLAQGSGKDLAPRLRRLYWWLEAQGRSGDGTDAEFDTAILRPGLGYEIFKDTTLWAGYGWFETFPADGDRFEEHRLWQQLFWSKPLGTFAFSSRTRLEQRFVQGGDEAEWRFRQWIKLTYPLPHRTSLVLTEEVFVSLNSTDRGATAGFDQNRLFLGVGYDLDACTRLEVGYLNQYINRSSGSDSMNHILAFNVLLNF